MAILFTMRVTFNDTEKHKVAARLFQTGMKKCDIARKVGVSNSTITNWSKRFDGEKLTFSRLPGDAVYYSTTGAQRDAIESYISSDANITNKIIQSLLIQDGLIDTKDAISRHSINRIRRRVAGH